MTIRKGQLLALSLLSGYRIIFKALVYLCLDYPSFVVLFNKLPCCRLFNFLIKHYLKCFNITFFLQVIAVRKGSLEKELKFWKASAFVVFPCKIDITRFKA